MKSAAEAGLDLHLDEVCKVLSEDYTPEEIKFIVGNLEEKIGKK